MSTSECELSARSGPWRRTAFGYAGFHVAPASLLSMIPEVLSKIAALLNSEGINYTVSVWAARRGANRG